MSRRQAFVIRDEKSVYERGAATLAHVEAKAKKYLKRYRLEKLQITHGNKTWEIRQLLSVRKAWCHGDPD